MHLVGFSIRIYHDARSSECQNCKSYSSVDLLQCAYTTAHHYFGFYYYYYYYYYYNSNISLKYKMNGSTNDFLKAIQTVFIP